MNSNDEELPTERDVHAKTMCLMYINNVCSGNEWKVYEDIAKYWNGNIRDSWHDKVGVTSLPPLNAGHVCVHYNWCDRLNPIPFMLEFYSKSIDLMEFVTEHGLVMQAHIAGTPIDKFKIAQSGPKTFIDLGKFAVDMFKQLCGSMMQLRMDHKLTQTILPGAAPQLKLPSIYEAIKKHESSGGGGGVGSTGANAHKREEHADYLF